MSEIAEGAGGGEAREESREPVDPQPTIDLLCEHFANDTLGMDEFERRVERAHRAGSGEELRALLADLPALGMTVPAEAEGPDGEAAGGGRALAEPVPVAPSAEVEERDVLLACLGGVERKGRWTPARSTFAAAVMGGVKIDLRDAAFPPGTTEIRAAAVWGAVEIIVPPGVQVECSGVGLLGGFGYEGFAGPEEPAPGAPKLRVTGFALMGGVEVSHRLPGESARDARRRRRQRRRELRTAARERNERRRLES